MYTGIFVSFIAVYGDEVLQNLLLASSTTIQEHSVTRIRTSLRQASNMKERCKCTFVRTVMISVQYRTIAKFANKTYIPNISMHSKRTIANVMCVCVCVRAIVAEKFEGSWDVTQCCWTNSF